MLIKITSLFEFITVKNSRMKTKADSKHKSLWKFIKVVDAGSCRVYALNETGKLKEKLCRQRTRDIFEEIRKLQDNNFNQIQFTLPNDINNTLATSQSIITTNYLPNFGSDSKKPNLANCTDKQSFTDISNSNESITNRDSIIHKSFITKPILNAKTSTNLNELTKNNDLDINEPFLNIKNLFDDQYYDDNDFNNNNSSDYIADEQNLTNENFFDHNDLFF